MGDRPRRGKGRERRETWADLAPYGDTDTHASTEETDMWQIIRGLVKLLLLWIWKKI